MPVTPAHPDYRRELMTLALEQARQAGEAGEVPVGCAIADGGGNILALAQNRRERDEDPTAHAEILAIRAAGQALGSWRLIGCTLAVTLEPCPMCAGAMVNARLTDCVFGCTDPKAGFAGTLTNLLQDPRLNHRVNLLPPVLGDESADLLRAFFRHQRSLGKK